MISLISPVQVESRNMPNVPSFTPRLDIYSIKKQTNTNKKSIVLECYRVLLLVLMNGRLLKVFCNWKQASVISALKKI